MTQQQQEDRTEKSATASPAPNQQQEPEPSRDADVRDDGVIKNPSLYARMSEPFASADAANEAFEDFFDEVRRLREQFKIRDVAIVVYDSVRTGDRQQDVITMGNNGDEGNVVAMLAWALGRAERHAADRVTRYAENLRKTGRSGATALASGSSSGESA